MTFQTALMIVMLPLLSERPSGYIAKIILVAVGVTSLRSRSEIMLKAHFQIGLVAEQIARCK